MRAGEGASHEYLILESDALMSGIQPSLVRRRRISPFQEGEVDAGRTAVTTVTATLSRPLDPP